MPCPKPLLSSCAFSLPFSRQDGEGSSVLKVPEFRNSTFHPLISPQGMCTKGPCTLFPPLSLTPAFPKAFLFCWLIPFGNLFCISVWSCFCIYFITQERKGELPSRPEGLEKTKPVSLMPTCSEPLNPCPNLPGTVPRLRPWLEKHFLQLEQPRRPRITARPPKVQKATNTNYWEGRCHPCGGAGEGGRG